MKKTTKTATKKVKFAVDITDLTSPLELYKRIADAKQKAGIALNDSEYEGLKNFYTENAIDVTIMIGPCPIYIKRAPWYKRLWRWITRKK